MFLEKALMFTESINICPPIETTLVINMSMSKRQLYVWDIRLCQKGWPIPIHFKPFHYFKRVVSCAIFIWIQFTPIGMWPDQMTFPDPSLSNYYTMLADAICSWMSLEDAYLISINMPALSTYNQYLIRYSSRKQHNWTVLKCKWDFANGTWTSLWD